MVLLLLLVLGGDGGIDLGGNAALARYLGDECESRETERWAALGEPPPCELLHAARPAPSTMEAAAALLAGAWKVPVAAAAPMLEVELASRSARLRYHLQPGDERWVDARLEAALAAAPGAPAVIHAIEMRGTSERLERALRAVPHAAPLALTLLASSDPDSASLGAAFAFTDDPSVLPRLVALKGGARLPLMLRLRLLELGLERRLPLPELSRLAASVAAGLLEDGLAELALEVWTGLPPRLREAAARLADFEAPHAEELRFLEFRLGVAALELGRPAQAGALAPLVREPDWKAASASTPWGDQDCSGEVYRELLLRARSRTRAARDPYPVARALQTCYRGPPLARAVAAALADRMPAVAVARLRMALRPGRSGPLKTPLPASVAAFCEPAAGRIEWARASRDRASRELLARLEGGTRAEPDVVARLLASAPLAPWKERPLPPGVSPARDERRSIVLPPDLRLPRRFWPVRLERSGESA